MTRKIASHYLSSRKGLIRNALVEVADDGKILSLGTAENIDSLCGVEFYSGILCPGWVNAHCHLELSYLRGAIAEGTGFAGFAREIGRTRGGFTPSQRLAAAEVADAAMRAEGVAAVGDVANDALIMPVKARSAIRYRTFAEAFGLTTDSTDSLGELLRYPSASPTPHSTYSLQDALFRRICSAGDAPLSIHFLESADEKALYSGCGSLAEWYGRMGWQCDFLGYGSPAARIAACVPPQRQVLLVHGCFAQREDIEMLDRHFDRPPFWVLCPESNRYISRLMPPVDLLREAGCRICLGTDSPASATTLSMVEQMRLLGDVPLEEMLLWATWNGACALGMEDDLGSIEPGKHPGIVLLEGVDMNAMKIGGDTRARRLV